MKLYTNKKKVAFLKKDVTHFCHQTAPKSGDAFRDEI